MSSSTWTARAVGSEALRSRRRLWRAVEAQHIASTLRLVAGVEEQLMLERLLDQSKPPLPAAAADLHYLLSTPFRYSSPIGSRFRAPADSGIWYGAEAQRTACAELGYWRWRFLMDSDALDAIGPAPQSVFRAGIDARLIDLAERVLDGAAKRGRLAARGPDFRIRCRRLAALTPTAQIAYNRRPPCTARCV